MLTRRRSDAQPLSPHPVRRFALAALALGAAALVVGVHPGRARADDDERRWGEQGGPDDQGRWAGDEQGDEGDRGDDGDRGWEKERKREEKELRREEKERRREERERQREWEHEREAEAQPDPGYAPDDEVREPVVEAPPPEQGPSFAEFHDALSPYGEWIDTPEYGRVWRPAAVSDDWRPYYRGHWAWTAAGWYWVADEPFGWAVYHYGRWAFLADVGWAWLPGQRWAPAWVAWRWGDGYAGWCPLGPRGLVYQRPVLYVIVQQQYFLQPVVHHAVPVVAAQTFFPRTQAMPAIAPGPRAGPVVHAVAAATRQTVRPLAIVDSSRPREGGPAVGGGKVFAYRPRSVPIATPATRAPAASPGSRPMVAPGRQSGPAAGPGSGQMVPGRQSGPATARPGRVSPAPAPAAQPQRRPPVREPPIRAAPARPPEERGSSTQGPHAGAFRRPEAGAARRPYLAEVARATPAGRPQAPRAGGWPGSLRQRVGPAPSAAGRPPASPPAGRAQLKR